MRVASLTILGSLFILACAGNTPPAGSPSDSGSDDAYETPADGESAGGGVGAESDDPNSFVVNEGTGTAGGVKGARESKLKPTDELTLIKFTIVDRGNNDAPMSGIVIKLTSPDGKTYFTPETDEIGFADVLVPKGVKYQLVYLSLGRKDIKASVPIDDKPRQTLALKLRYKKIRPPQPQVERADEEPTPGFVLDGVNFDTGKSTIRPDSFERLDKVSEYMSHKKSARIQISGHTDNVGKPESNKKLSQDRADACRKYLVDKGIEASRIEAIGYGQDLPIAPNDTPEGRQRNRRIEAIEL